MYLMKMSFYSSSQSQSELNQRESLERDSSQLERKALEIEDQPKERRKSDL